MDNGGGVYMATTKAQQRAVHKYVRENYDRIGVTVPRGLKSLVEAHAQSKGESVNGLVNALLRADMGLSEGEWKARAESAQEGD
jgi:hypothetical protein